MRYSIIIPVYNRPDEIDELLESIRSQTFSDYEVIVVEDGSSLKCETVAGKYVSDFNVKYLYKENSGPGQSRNYGAERASGEYLIFLDSDAVLPEGYLAEVGRELKAGPSDAFGGPDRAHESFSDVQKAINYSMTSFFTTGGIRGGKKKMDKFYPRSFNMGIRREVYKSLGGFSSMRFGEDIDLSIRIFKGGYRCRLFPGAWVWHKRRVDFGKFYRQVFNSGMARIALFNKYPDSLKLVHMLPMAFAVGECLLVLMSLLLFSLCPLIPIVLYALMLSVDSFIKNRSVRIALLSVVAAFIQLTGYGMGFVTAWVRCRIFRQNDFFAFRTTFYK